MHESLPGFAIKLRSQEFQISSNLLSGLTGVFAFETRSHGTEVWSESEVESEQAVVDAKTNKTEPLAITVIEVNRFHVRVFVEIGTIGVHLFLTFNILEELSTAPPVLGSLNEDSVWFEFLNEFLSTLSQHGRLVGSSNEIDILSIESLGQMHESSIEDVVSI